ncbi:MAG: phosphomannomutase [Candidatus Competibacteraceae bacterium]|jgi:phosphomannomutase|nr:phosphomannomutase [Candidatus Competibacteraceae bacterium]
MSSLTCFKAYDIRGRIPEQLNPEIAYRIGRAYATFLQPRRVIVGHDVRLSSPELCKGLMQGLMDSGVDVVDIGLCGTEEVYFATFAQQTDGGIMVTASHNPSDFNGMKLVREQSRPISGDSGLNRIRELAEHNVFAAVQRQGKRLVQEDKSAYIQHLLGYVDHDVLQPLTVVVNAGNGGAGLVIDQLESHLPFRFIKIQHMPDGHFPNGIPNPLLPECREVTRQAVLDHGADLGLAWDGDFDRCFFFDEQGRFIEGYYLVGLLAEIFLQRQPGDCVIHDPRLTWNTVERVLAAGGTAVQSKTGHAFIKERMRAEDAVYGGEMSAHHYFRTFAYCDSGMIPWLLVSERLCRGARLSTLVDEAMQAFPCSGEINFRVADVAATIQSVLETYTPLQPKLDYTDGVSVEFPQWRFNLRGSNTEPLLRLNVETRGDEELLSRCTEQLRTLLMQE